MKKLFFILSLPLLLLLAALFTAGCGNSQKKTVIGVSIPSADHGWTGGVVYWAEKAAKELEKKYPDVKILVTTSADSAEQVSHIENMLIQNIKALVVLPHEPAPLAGICKQAKDKKVFLTVVDRNLAGNIEDLAIAGDNTGFGKACAEEMAKLLKGKGNIVIMEGVLCDVNTLRVNAFREVMKKYPAIKILDSQTANWNTEQGLKLMETYLGKYKHIDAVWAGDDDVLLGALKAYEESKRKDVKLFIGGGGAKLIIKKIVDKDPLIPVNVTYPPRMIAYGMEYTINKILGKQEIKEKKIIIPAEVITRENASKFYFPDSIY